MTYPRRSHDPYQFEELRRQMDRFLEHVTHRRSFTAAFAPEHWQPRIDVYQTKEAVVVLVELAGMSPQGIQLAVQGRALTVSGTRQPRFHGNPCQFSRLEVPWGQFKCRVDLPAPVDDARAEAQYSDGLLQVVLPLAVPVHPAIAGPAGVGKGRR